MSRTDELFRRALLSRQGMVMSAAKQGRAAHTAFVGRLGRLGEDTDWSDPYSTPREPSRLTDDAPGPNVPYNAPSPGSSPFVPAGTTYYTAPPLVSAEGTVYPGRGLVAANASGVSPDTSFNAYPGSSGPGLFATLFSAITSPKPTPYRPPVVASSGPLVPLVVGATVLVVGLVLFTTLRG